MGRGAAGPDRRSFLCLAGVSCESSCVLQSSRPEVALSGSPSFRVRPGRIVIPTGRPHRRLTHPSLTRQGPAFLPPARARAPLGSVTSGIRVRWLPAGLAATRTAQGARAGRRQWRVCAGGRAATGTMAAGPRGLSPAVTHGPRHVCRRRDRRRRRQRVLRRLAARR